MANNKCVFKWYLFFVLCSRDENWKPYKYLVWLQFSKTNTKRPLWLALHCLNLSILKRHIKLTLTLPSCSFHFTSFSSLILPFIYISIFQSSVDYSLTASVIQKTLFVKWTQINSFNVLSNFFFFYAAHKYLPESLVVNVTKSSLDQILLIEYKKSYPILLVL